MLGNLPVDLFKMFGTTLFSHIYNNLSVLWIYLKICYIIYPAHNY